MHQALSLSTQPRQYSVPLWRNGWSTKVQAQSGTERNTVIASGTISLSLVPNPTYHLTRKGVWSLLSIVLAVLSQQSDVPLFHWLASNACMM